MSQPIQEMDLDSLTIPERLELIGRLWDSITDSGAEVPVPEWHLRELATRRAAAEAAPGAGIAWEEVKAVYSPGYESSVDVAVSAASLRSAREARRIFVNVLWFSRR